MKARCANASGHGFRHYGGRGVYVCDEWQTFIGFLDWALTHGYGEALQIDRVDADGWYEPNNCRWIPSDLNLSRRELERSGMYLAGLQGKLSQDVAEQSQPRSRAYKLADGKGLSLLVRPSGTKSWQYSYRFDGKYRLLTLGQFPARPVRHARELHAVARSQLSRGVDPSAVKRESKQRSLRRKRTP